MFILHWYLYPMRTDDIKKYKINELSVLLVRYTL